MQPQWQQALPLPVCAWASVRKVKRSARSSSAHRRARHCPAPAALRAAPAARGAASAACRLQRRVGGAKGGRATCSIGFAHQKEPKRAGGRTYGVLCVLSRVALTQTQCDRSSSSTHTHTKHPDRHQKRHQKR